MHLLTRCRWIFFSSYFLFSYSMENEIGPFLLSFPPPLPTLAPLHLFALCKNQKLISIQITDKNFFPSFPFFPFFLPFFPFITFQASQLLTGWLNDVIGIDNTFFESNFWNENFLKSFFFKHYLHFCLTSNVTFKKIYWLLK